ncbi:hypothetical protein JHW43_004058 [Diplocarpon mali]|nr:hypothetical protein JHW43_004058 [Diplocarpon mali]
MWSGTTYLSLLLVPASGLQISSILAPFYEPYTEKPIQLSNESSSSEHEFLKRDGNCPANFNSCSTFRDSAGGACCTAGSFCTTDRSDNIACCPTGASCTGSLDIATARPAGGGVLGGGTVAAGTTTTTTTGGTTGTSTNPAATITGTVSYVANDFFPFPYIPVSYVNSAACNSAYNDCQTNYAACTFALGGGGSGNAGFGVTIVAPNGGVTATPTIQNLGLASATSLCSSLSSVGCYNIVSTNCAQFGTGTEISFVTGTTDNGAARPTAAVKGCYAAAGVMAGVGLGIAGQLV